MLENEKYYHIYNRTNGPVPLFKNAEDYKRFLRLMQRFIPPVADLLAWALMGNHFHFVVRIQEERVYRYSKEEFNKNSSSSNADGSTFPFPNADGSHPSGDAVRFGNTARFEAVKWETVPANNRSASKGNRSASNGPDRVTAKYANPTKHFAHLFNAYAKYFNIRHNRTGSLFQPQFQKNHIDSENYLRQAIIYTHQNPVKHGFVQSPQEYIWSSYHEYTDPNTTSDAIKSTRHELFDDVENFIAVHEEITGSEGFESF